MSALRFLFRFLLRRRKKRAKKKKQNALKRFSQRALLFFPPFFTQASKYLPVRALLAMGQVRFPLVFVTSQREEVKLLNAIASRCSHLSFSLSLFLSLLPNPPQAMSFGLTQYDVEELIAYCGGACKWF